MEVVAAMALVGLLAGIVLPALPRGTSRARLEGYAVETATLLKADRNTAVRRGITVTTEVDASARSVRSRITGRAVRYPPDVSVEARLASRCNHRRSEQMIQFFASGTSCGGTITLARGTAAYQIRVNWLTGGVEIVPLTRS